MLMISITLALAAMLVAWAGTTYGTFSSGTGIYFVQRGQALQERFVIENVFFNKPTSTVMIFVRNVGAEDANIVGLYMNGEAYTPQTGAGFCAIPVDLGVGSVCEFSIKMSATWASGAIFNIVVTSARGNRATFTVRGS
jgi:hypothetical protein